MGHNAYDRQYAAATAGMANAGYEDLRLYWAAKRYLISTHALIEIGSLRAAAGTLSRAIKELGKIKFDRLMKIGLGKFRKVITHCWRLLKEISEVLQYFPNPKTKTRTRPK